MRTMLLLFIGLLPFSAGAEIFRCMDASGKIRYFLTRPTIICHAARSDATASRPAAIAKVSAGQFPRVDAATQRARDMSRREILENELADEMRLHQTAEATERAAHHERNIEALRREIASIR